MTAGVSWRRNQIAVTAAAFMGFTGFTLVMPFLPLYISQLGVRDVGEIALWSGLSLGVTPAVTAVLSPFWGRIADRFGRKLMVERSLISFVAIMLATAYVTRPWHILALRALQGLFAGFGGLTIAMAAESAPRERMASAIGLVQTSQRIGPAVGPVIGGVVAGMVGLRQAFVVTAAFYAIAFVVVFVFYRDSPVRQERAASAGSDQAGAGALLRSRGFLLPMAAIFGLTFVDRSFGPILPLYVQQLGFAPERVVIVSGLLLSATAVGAALGNQVCESLLRRRAAVTVIAGSSLSAGVALALFLGVSRAGALATTLGLFGMAVGIATTTAYTAGGRRIPAGRHGTGFGLLTGASLAGLALSPVVSGLLSRGSLLAVFGLDLALLVVVAAVTRRWMQADDADRLPPAQAPAADAV